LLPNDKWYEIYYDTEAGTLAAANYFKGLTTKERTIKYIELEGGGEA